MNRRFVAMLGGGVVLLAGLAVPAVAASRLASWHQNDYSRDV